jgi:hypothetical protein
MHVPTSCTNATCGRVRYDYENQENSEDMKKGSAGYIIFNRDLEKQEC